MRSNSWAKFKNINLGDLRDTLDLIPVGAYYGKGARTGVFGSYLMAAYNTQTRCFESVCKLGTGFSQQNLIDLHHRVKRLDAVEHVAQRIASEIFKVSNN